MQRHVGNLYLRQAFLQDGFPIFPMAKPLAVTPEQRIFQRASIDPTGFCLLRVQAKDPSAHNLRCTQMEDPDLPSPLALSHFAQAVETHPHPQEVTL